MLLKEEERNIYTGLLGTLAFHLLLVIAVLIGRLEKVHTVHKEQPIEIEFDEQAFKTLEQMVNDAKTKEAEIPSLSDEVVKNIAVNTANKLNEEISTEKYIQDVKDELGIKELNQQLDRDLGDDPVLDTKKEPKPEPAKKIIYRGPTRISYDLAGRTDRYIHNPVYICQGNGNVVISIVVDTEGKVINASIASTNTKEECVMETALDAARKSLFNADSKADPRQKGTLSFEFVAQ